MSVYGSWSMEGSILLGGGGGGQERAMQGKKGGMGKTQREREFLRVL